VPKKSTDKPSAQTAEDPTIVIATGGQYLVFYATNEILQYLADLLQKLPNSYVHIDVSSRWMKLNRQSDTSAKDPSPQITDAFLSRQRDFLVSLLNTFDKLTSTQPRIGVKPAIKAANRAIHARPKSIEEKAIDEMIAKAAEVLGSRDEGMRWLGNPVRGLDFATPISLLGTPEGVLRVNDILGQIEHGIW
jgi:hypothetical protein